MPGLSSIFPVLQTAMLDLIEITGNHIPALFQLFTNKQVTEFYNVIPLNEEADAQRIVDMLSNKFKEGSGIRWGISLKGSHELIGTIGFNTFTKGHKATLVYAIMPGYWGKGYMTEAIRVVTKFGFDKLQANRIEAEVMPGNIGSEKVLEKAGFSHEGLLRQWIYWEGKWYNANMYSLLKSDLAASSASGSAI